MNIWIVKEKSSDGLPSVVLVTVMPSSKTSVNGRTYVEETVEQSVSQLQSDLHNGIQKLIFYSHQPMVRNENGDYAGFDSKNTKPAGEIVDIYLTEEKEVKAVVRLFHTFPDGVAVAERIAKSDFPDVSLRGQANCSRPHGTGDCYLLDFDGFDFLKPHEEPGLPGSKVVAVIEGCQSQAAPPLTETESLTRLEGDSSMNLQALLKSLSKQGLSPEAAKAVAFETFGEGAAEEIEAAIASYTPELAMAAQAAAGSSIPPAPVTPVSEPPVPPLVEACSDPGEPDMDDPKMKAKMKAKAKVNESVEDQILAELIRERQAEKTKQEIIQYVHSALAQKRFGSHVLENQVLYPAPQIKSLCQAITESNCTSKEKAEGMIEIGLQGIAADSSKASLGVRKGRPSQIEVTEGKKYMEYVEIIDKSINDQLKKTNSQRLERCKENGQLASIKEARQKAFDNYEKQYGPVLHAAVNFQRRLQNDEDFRTEIETFQRNPVLPALPTYYNGQPIKEDAGQILIGAAQLPNQAFLNLVFLKRIFEEAPFLQFVRTLGSEALIPYQDPTLVQFGRHFRFPIEWYKEAPLTYSEFRIRNENQGYVEVDTSTSYDEAFSQEYGLGFAYNMRAVQQMLTGPLHYDVVGQMMTNLSGTITRSVSRRMIDRIDNNARKFRSVAVTGENPASTEFTSGATITVGGITRSYASTDVTYADGAKAYGVRAIVRLKTGQLVTGTSIVPNILVRPEERTFLNTTRAVQTLDSLVEYPVVCTLASVGTSVMGDLRRSDGRIVAKNPGETPHYAIDDNLGLLLISTVASSVSAYGDVTGVGYSYNTANVVRHSVNLLSGETRGSNTDDLIMKFSGNCAGKAQTQLVSPELAIMSKTIGQGLLPMANMWKLLEARIGGMLAQDFSATNAIGGYGACQFWATNAEMPGQDFVIPVVRRYDTAYALSESIMTLPPQMNYIVPTAASVGALAGQRVRPTFGQSTAMRWQDVVFTPRVRDDAGATRHEPSFLVVLDGQLPSFLA